MSFLPPANQTQTRLNILLLHSTDVPSSSEINIYKLFNSITSYMSVFLWMFRLRFVDYLERAVFYISDFNSHVVWCTITPVEAQQVSEPYMKQDEHI